MYKTTDLNFAYVIKSENIIENNILIPKEEVENINKIITSFESEAKTAGNKINFQLSFLIKHRQNEKNYDAIHKKALQGIIDQFSGISTKIDILDIYEDMNEVERRFVDNTEEIGVLLDTAKFRFIATQGKRLKTLSPIERNSIESPDYLLQMDGNTIIENTKNFYRDVVLLENSRNKFPFTYYTRETPRGIDSKVMLISTNSNSVYDKVSRSYNFVVLEKDRHANTFLENENKLFNNIRLQLVKDSNNFYKVDEIPLLFEDNTHKIYKGGRDYAPKVPKKAALSSPTLNGINQNIYLNPNRSWQPKKKIDPSLTPWDVNFTFPPFEAAINDIKHKASSPFQYIRTVCGGGYVFSNYKEEGGKLLSSNEINERIIKNQVSFIKKFATYKVIFEAWIHTYKIIEDLKKVSANKPAKLSLESVNKRYDELIAIYQKNAISDPILNNALPYIKSNTKNILDKIRKDFDGQLQSNPKTPIVYATLDKAYTTYQQIFSEIYVYNSYIFDRLKKAELDDAKLLVNCKPEEVKHIKDTNIPFESANIDNINKILKNLEGDGAIDYLLFLDSKYPEKGTIFNSPVIQKTLEEKFASGEISPYSFKRKLMIEGADSGIENAMRYPPFKNAFGGIQSEYSGIVRNEKSPFYGTDTMGFSSPKTLVQNFVIEPFNINNNGLSINDINYLTENNLEKYIAHAIIQNKERFKTNEFDIILKFVKKSNIDTGLKSMMIKRIPQLTEYFKANVIAYLKVFDPLLQEGADYKKQQDFIKFTKSLEISLPVQNLVITNESNNVVFNPEEEADKKKQKGKPQNEEIKTQTTVSYVNEGKSPLPLRSIMGERAGCSLKAKAYDFYCGIRNTISPKTAESYDGEDIKRIVSDGKEKGNRKGKTAFTSIGIVYTIADYRQAVKLLEDVVQGKVNAPSDMISAVTSISTVALEPLAEQLSKNLAMRGYKITSGLPIAVLAGVGIPLGIYDLVKAVHTMDKNDPKVQDYLKMLRGSISIATSVAMVIPGMQKVAFIASIASDAVISGFIAGLDIQDALKILDLTKTEVTKTFFAGFFNLETPKNIEYANRYPKFLESYFNRTSQGFYDSSNYQQYEEDFFSYYKLITPPVNINAREEGEEYITQGATPAGTPFSHTERKNKNVAYDLNKTPTKHIKFPGKNYEKGTDKIAPKYVLIDSRDDFPIPLLLNIFSTSENGKLNSTKVYNKRDIISEDILGNGVHTKSKYTEEYNIRYQGDANGTTYPFILTGSTINPGRAKGGFFYIPFKTEAVTVDLDKENEFKDKNFVVDAKQAYRIEYVGNKKQNTVIASATSGYIYGKKEGRTTVKITENKDKERIEVEVFEDVQESSQRFESREDDREKISLKNIESLIFARDGINLNIKNSRNADSGSANVQSPSCLQNVEIESKSFNVTVMEDSYQKQSINILSGSFGTIAVINNPNLILQVGENASVMIDFQGSFNHSFISKQKIRNIKNISYKKTEEKIIYEIKFNDGSKNNITTEGSLNFGIQMEEGIFSPLITTNKKEGDVTHGVYKFYNISGKTSKEVEDHFLTISNENIYIGKYGDGIYYGSKENNIYKASFNKEIKIIDEGGKNTIVIEPNTNDDEIPKEAGLKKIKCTESSLLDSNLISFNEYDKDTIFFVETNGNDITVFPFHLNTKKEGSFFNEREKIKEMVQSAPFKNIILISEETKGYLAKLLDFYQNSIKVNILEAELQNSLRFLINHQYYKIKNHSIEKIKNVNIKSIEDTEVNSFEGFKMIDLKKVIEKEGCTGVALPVALHDFRNYFVLPKINDIENESVIMRTPYGDYILRNLQYIKGLTKEDPGFEFTFQFADGAILNQADINDISEKNHTLFLQGRLIEESEVYQGISIDHGTISHNNGESVAIKAEADKVSTLTIWDPHLFPLIEKTEFVNTDSLEGAKNLNIYITYLNRENSEKINQKITLEDAVFNLESGGDGMNGIELKLKAGSLEEVFSMHKITRDYYNLEAKQDAQARQNTLSSAEESDVKHPEGQNDDSKIIRKREAPDILEMEEQDEDYIENQNTGLNQTPREDEDKDYKITIEEAIKLEDSIISQIKNINDKMLKEAQSFNNNRKLKKDGIGLAMVEIGCIAAMIEICRQGLKPYGRKTFDVPKIIGSFAIGAGAMAGLQYIESLFLGVDANEVGEDLNDINAARINLADSEIEDYAMQNLQTSLQEPKIYPAKTIMYNIIKPVRERSQADIKIIEEGLNTINWQKKDTESIFLISECVTGNPESKFYTLAQNVLSIKETSSNMEERQIKKTPELNETIPEKHTIYTHTLPNGITIKKEQYPTKTIYKHTKWRDGNENERTHTTIQSNYLFAEKHTSINANERESRIDFNFPNGKSYFQVTTQKQNQENRVYGTLPICQAPELRTYTAMGLPEGGCMASVDEAKEHSNKALADFEESLKKNFKAEFWDSLIQSLGISLLQKSIYTGSREDVKFIISVGMKTALGFANRTLNIQSYIPDGVALVSCTLKSQFPKLNQKTIDIISKALTYSAVYGTILTNRGFATMPIMLGSELGYRIGNAIFSNLLNPISYLPQNMQKAINDILKPTDIAIEKICDKTYEVAGNVATYIGNITHDFICKPKEDRLFEGNAKNLPQADLWEYFGTNTNNRANHFLQKVRQFIPENKIQDLAVVLFRQAEVLRNTRKSYLTENNEDFENYLKRLMFLDEKIKNILEEKIEYTDFTSLDLKQMQKKREVFNSGLQSR